MSEISSLTASLNKEKMVMKDLLAIVDRESAGVSLGIDAISSLVKHFEGKVRDKSRIEEERLKKLAQIDGEVAELEKKKANLESTISEKNTNLDQLNQKLGDLQRTLATTKEGIQNTAHEADGIEQSIRDKERESGKLSSEFSSVKKKHESQIQSLRKAHDETVSKLAWKESQHKALRLLIKEKAIAFPELKVIEILRDQPTVTMDHLMKVTQSRRDEIEATVGALSKRGVLEYNSGSGEIRVLRPMEL